MVIAIPAAKAPALPTEAAEKYSAIYAALQQKQAYL
jgi:hypothetical protein